MSKYHVTQAKQDLSIKSLMETLIASNAVAVTNEVDSTDNDLIAAYDTMLRSYSAYRQSVFAAKEVLQERGELL